MDTQTAPLLEELQAIRARAKALVDAVPDDRAFQWQPDAGRRWSVGQCLEHLNQMNRLYFAAIRGALEGAARAEAPIMAPLRSTWFGRWFTAEMGPGGRKAQTPKKARPRSVAGRDEIAAEFLQGLDAIETVLHDAATIDLNRTTFPSPFFRFSRVRAGTGFRILLAHMRRHLGQAEQVSAGERG